MQAVLMAFIAESQEILQTMEDGLISLSDNYLEKHRALDGLGQGGL